MNSFVRKIVAVAVMVGLASAQAGWKDPRTWHAPKMPKLRSPFVKPDSKKAQ